MKKLKTYFSSILAFGGSLLMAMGKYFVLLRPYFLPDDLHYINKILSIFKDKIPGLKLYMGFGVRVNLNHLINNKIMNRILVNSFV